MECCEALQGDAAEAPDQALIVAVGNLFFALARVSQQVVYEGAEVCGVDGVQVNQSAAGAGLLAHGDAGEAPQRSLGDFQDRIVNWLRSRGDHRQITAQTLVATDRLQNRQKSAQASTLASSCASAVMSALLGASRPQR